MKILITGAAGFIASHIADACINDNHIVSIIDDLSTGVRENINPKADFHQIDIRNKDIEKIFQAGRFDALIHHAAQLDVRKSVTDPCFDSDVNIVGALNLYENARKYGVKKIIFASTGGAIYGEQDEFPATEKHPCRPISPYGIAKYSNEAYLYYYKQIWGIDHVILRYANVYGPRQNPHGEAGVVAIFSERMLRNEPVVINGDGKQTRDYVYIDDVVRANMLALSYKGSNIFNIGTGIETDVNAIFNILRANLSPNYPIKYGPAKTGEQQRSVISYKKIENEIGWKPAVNIKEGLQRTAEYFKQKVK